MASEEKTSASASTGADAADATSSTTPAPTTDAAEAPATKAADTTTAPAPAPAEAGQAKETSAGEQPAELAPAEAAPATSKAAGKAPAAASSSTGAAPKPKAKVKATGKNYNTDPALWIYTSLTAGNMHIVTATSRLETILRANRVPFKATDLATDEKARMLWGRRAGKTAEGKPRRLPALVQTGMVLGV